MIGIDISRQSMKIVRLSNDRERRLLAHCWHDVPAGLMERGVVHDEQTMRQIVQEAFAQCNLSGRTADTVVASIPETESFLRVIEIPKMDESEVTEAVQWEVAQHIPFGLENVYIDWQYVPRDDGEEGAGDRQEVLVGAAEKRVIDPLFSLLRSLDFDVGAFELESQAIVRALISPELRQRKGLLIVDLGGSATNVAVHDRGTVRFTASLQKGTDELHNVLTPEEAAAVTGAPKETIEADADAIAQKLQPNFDRLVVEVHGVVEFYTGLDSRHQVNEILLTGGGSNLPGLDHAFLRHFDDVHVQRGNPWVNILPSGKDIALPMSIQQSVHFSTALGLALRPVLR